MECNFALGGYVTTDFTLPIRIYYDDTDAGGVVYYANYLKYYERARSEWLRELGYPQDEMVTTHGVVFAVRSVQIDYLVPARFQDLLDVTVQVETCKRASVDVLQRVTRGDIILSEARIRIACISLEASAPCAIPKELHALLSKPGTS